MAALTKDRNTATKHREYRPPLKMKAATKILAGAIIAVDANGWAVPASDTAGLIVMGRADETVDNTAGANGDLLINYSTGVFKWGTTGGSAAVQADVGDPVFVLDDNNVVKTAGTANTIKAGRMVQLDDDGGIWVDTRMTW